MTRPQYQPTISLGNLLQIGALLVAVTGSYFLVKADTEANADAITKLQAAQERGDARIRALETNAARSDERLQSILGLLNRIDARLERIENNETH